MPDLRHPLRMYAHRGAAAEQPENTLPAFHRAMELGADALETDVHMSKDGHVVVSHDPDGARMAGVHARICDTELADIEQWDVGYGYLNADGERPFAGKGYRIPTLEQVLTEFPGVVVNVDLKQTRPPIASRVLGLLRRLRAEDRVILASFSLLNLLRVRVRKYPGTTALSRTEVLGLLLTPQPLFRALPLTGAAAQIPPRVGPLSLGERKVIDKCHDLGLRVDFWTIDAPGAARRLLELGADGIMTDDPAGIAPVFQEHRSA